MSTSAVVGSRGAEQSTSGMSRVMLPPDVRPSRRWLVGIWTILAAIVALMLVVGRRGPGPRINRSLPPRSFIVHGAAYAQRPLWGIGYWPQIFEIASVVLAVALLAVFSRLSWRERRLHPGLTLVLAATGMYLLDPIFNWSWYFPTDPRFLHWPINWPYVRINPTSEPMAFMPAYTFWLMIPALITYAIWRPLRGRPRARHSWIERRPLVALVLLGSAVSIPWDFCGFWLGTVTKVFIFSQATSPLVRAGQASQQPILWEPLLFPMVITGTCVLFAWRDDKGDIIPVRIARRLRTFRAFPRLSEIIVAWAILAIIYLGSALGAGAFVFRGVTTPRHLARPWPYADTRVYDPNGLYQKAGQPGLYHR
jgi:Spirocyclase AveC-like